jgi:hypothetical protein
MRRAIGASGASTGIPQEIHREILLIHRRKCDVPRLFYCAPWSKRGSLRHSYPTPDRSTSGTSDRAVDFGGGSNGTRLGRLTGVDPGVRLVWGLASGPGAGAGICGCSTGHDPRHLPALPRRIPPRTIRRRTHGASRHRRDRLEPRQIPPPAVHPRGFCPGIPATNSRRPVNPIRDYLPPRRRVNRATRQLGNLAIWGSWLPGCRIA